MNEKKIKIKHKKNTEIKKNFLNFFFYYFNFTNRALTIMLYISSYPTQQLK